MIPRAFPFTPNPGSPHNDAGMSLRDYFAAAALTGMYVSNRNFYSEATGRDVVTHDEFAALAYETADAMLKARQG